LKSQLSDVRTMPSEDRVLSQAARAQPAMPSDIPLPLVRPWGASKCETARSPGDSPIGKGGSHSLMCIG